MVVSFKAMDWSYNNLLDFTLKMPFADFDKAIK